jgi:outer membrane protein
MKKISLITSAMIALATAAAADVIGGEVAIGGWNHDPSGWIQYPSNSTGANKIDLDDDLNLDTKGEIYLRAKIEHPIPVLPNIKLAYTQVTSSGESQSTQDFKFGNISIPVGAATTTDAQLDSYDATFYYEIVDIGMDLDLGITARYIDGYTDITVNPGTPLKQHDKSDFSMALPMLYANVRVPIPFLGGLSVGAEGNYVTYDGSTVYDLQADVRYTLMMGLGIEAGYRAQKYKLDDVDDTSSDIDIQGFFIGAVWDF